MRKYLVTHIPYKDLEDLVKENLGVEWSYEDDAIMFDMRGGLEPIIEPLHEFSPPYQVLTVLIKTCILEPGEYLIW